MAAYIHVCTQTRMYAQSVSVARGVELLVEESEDTRNISPALPLALFFVTLQHVSRSRRKNDKHDGETTA